MPANAYDSTSKTWTGPDNIRYYIIGSVNKLGIACEPCSITKGTEFRSGQSFTVARYKFEMTSTGQARIKDTVTNLTTWSKTAYGSGAFLAYQSDGNICIYDASNVVKWCSMTNNIASSTLTITFSATPGSDATVAYDGKLALKNSSGAIVWFDT